MKGTYVTQFNLFVPGRKGLEQPGAHFSAPYLGLSLCLSLSNTQMHTHVHTRAHTCTHMPYPKMAVVLACWPCWLEGAVEFVLVSRMNPRGFQAM